MFVKHYGIIKCAIILIDTLGCNWLSVLGTFQLFISLKVQTKCYVYYIYYLDS